MPIQLKKTNHPRSAGGMASTLDLGFSTAAGAVERFNLLIEISKTDLRDLKKAFDDTNGSMKSFNELFGLSNTIASAKESAAIGEKSERTLAESQKERLNNEIEGALRVTRLLRTAFSDTGNDFLGSLGKALEIVRQMSRVFESLHSDGGNGGLLPLFEGAASLFSLFAGGGYTGDISSGRAAGIVHGGEIVFEKPLVDQHKQQLLALRQILQRGGSFKDLFSGTGAESLNFSANDLTPLLAEIRLLRNENRQLTDAVRNLEIQAPVILEGTLNGQQFLRKEMPAFESFNKKKLL